MSAISPLTAGIEIARSISGSQSRAISPPGPEQFTADPFASDRQNLAAISPESLQLNNNAQTSGEKEAPALANESVSVSSSTGGGHSRGNLTAERAIRLYQTVSNLL
ncbi:MAG: hypothetical protein ACJA0N_001954 [Pseudohongiellaceae bacterium]|jgi:hypothetical protein